MTDKPRVVYLEDLEAPSTSSSQTAVDDHDAASSASGASQGETKSDSKTTTTLKRQRTLIDMFATPSSKAPKPKRLKSDGSPSTRISNSGSGTLNSIPFSLSSFQDSLSDESRTLLTLECETMGRSWLKVLKDEITKPYFLNLKRFLAEQGVRGPNDSAKVLQVYPSPQNIYSWSNLTTLGHVKVVIIGQDPYHGPGQAHGLCFSVPPGVAIPPSLRNIYAEIKAEYPEFEIPKHGNLTGWAESGVLLLNTCLTVKAGKAGSHNDRGWEEFTDKVVDVIDKYGGANLPNAAGRGRGVVFMAWGAWAAKRVAKLDKKKHLILTSVHPSPLSAYRGFLGNGHFKRANEWLEQKYGQDGCVDWCKL